MTEPWKRTTCETPECIRLTYDAKGRVYPDFYLYPNLDNENLTQFVCSRCGGTQTWGVTRRNVQKILYERFNG